LALFTGVVSTTPVVVSTWPTQLTTPSSEEVVVEVPRLGTVPAPTQRRSHVLGGPDPPSRHMFVASSMITSLATLSGRGRGGNRPPSPQGAKGKEAMEIDSNDLGQALMIVSGVSVTTASLTLRQEFGTPIVPLATGNQGKDAMDIDDVNANCCLGQPVAALIQMGSPRGGEGSAGRLA